MTNLEVARLLAALALLITGAHAVGSLFARFRQPRVIGEIVAGIILGPTLLGLLAPSVEKAIFPTTGASSSTLSAVSQIGLFLLMFVSGAELRSVFARGEGRAVSIITVVAVALPFLLGLGLVQLIDTGSLLGRAQNKTALTIVFALAIAVTSIPVISRIMFDLGILHTPFARIVLGVAVVEDTVIYVVLAIALGLVSGTSGDNYGLANLVGLEPGSAAFLSYHVVITLVFFVGMLRWGSKLYSWALRQRLNVLQTSSPIAYQLVFVLASTLACVALGLTPMLGAFLAGIAASAAPDVKAAAARGAVKDFAFAFFVPVYFAMVGLKLDLVHHFDPVFFVWFLVFATVVKTASVYLGARLAREQRAGALNLAVAMNARGGPGIVLATVTLTAGVINQEFYAALVLLVIITSLAAGAWLDWIVRTGRELRPDPKRAAPTDVTVPVQAGERVDSPA